MEVEYVHNFTMINIYETEWWKYLTSEGVHMHFIFTFMHL